MFLLFLFSHACFFLFLPASHPSVSAEALNQRENVDLDALMADLCSIEQELSTINAKPNSSGSMARLGITDTKVRTIIPLVAGCTFTDCASYDELGDISSF